MGFILNLSPAPVPIKTDIVLHFSLCGCEHCSYWQNRFRNKLQNKKWKWRHPLQSEGQEHHARKTSLQKPVKSLAKFMWNIDIYISTKLITSTTIHTLYIVMDPKNNFFLIMNQPNYHVWIIIRVWIISVHPSINFPNIHVNTKLSWIQLIATRPRWPLACKHVQWNSAWLKEQYYFRMFLGQEKPANRNKQTNKKSNKNPKHLKGSEMESRQIQI